MREQLVLVYGLSAGCVVLGLFLAPPAADGFAVAALLIVLCLLTARLLLGLMGQRQLYSILAAVAAAGVAAWLLHSGSLPLCAVLAADVCFTLSPNARGLCLAPLGIVLAVLVVAPGPAAIVGTALVLLPLLCILYLCSTLEKARRREALQAEELEALRNRLAAGQRGAKALEQAARLEERNRLAVRIHDRIGHGVSGSILLLEAALLTMDTQPGQAKQTVAAAAENLRGSVDDIRAALREERATKSEAGLAAIEAALSVFSAQHPQIKTQFTTSGSLSGLPAAVWLCIEENLREALTNLLKHSAATTLQVTIERQHKLTCARIQDNGAVTGAIVPGIGLDAMAERCLRCGGRLFFSGDETGFRLTMAFTETGGTP